ncbi:MAG: asparagine synthase (glutamine-hydrolyzing) [Clostridia bacterium]|jgi:asparagine synthase (glutamine-hydrolysing)|nr:asparagine synthase (glutamine-hydrolyzing) [Clostridia bacterium]
MSGFVGIVSPKINIAEANKSLAKVNHRGSDEQGFYLNESENVFFGHKRLVVVDKENGKQPFCFKEFVLIYNGELYNMEELRNDLIKKGYDFIGYSDTEVLIKLYVEYKEKCVEKLNGIFSFAIWNEKTKELFGCRDHVGVKPFYYYLKNKNNGDFMVCSEIKSILSYFKINSITSDGLREILGLGPSHTPGCGIYPNVYELKAGHYLKYKPLDLNAKSHNFSEKLTIERYWNVPAIAHSENFDETAKKTRHLLEDSIRRQLTSDVPLCSFLSGGLDSTAITLIARKFKLDLETFSIDYLDNYKYFSGNDFQVSQDNDFIKLLIKRFQLKHNYITINNEQLVDTLYDALVLKDFPGMVDVDSSLYWFSKQVKQRFTVALSGECSDEIFGGYPWFYKEQQNEFFPWIRNLDERNSLLNQKFRDKLNLINYVKERYIQTLKETPLTGMESKQDKRHKQLTYLNLLWFMQTLLDRNDRMTTGAGLEVRVPFADHRLIEYLYNVPWKYKFDKNREKGLLREAVKDIVPDEILNRKKNPYPKTHNPKYLNSVKKLLKASLKNKNSILNYIFDKKALQNLFEDSIEQKPWFGQLMTRPQLIAYLYQFDLWFKHYTLNLIE